MAGLKGRSGRRPEDSQKVFSDEIIKNVKRAASKLKRQHKISIEEAALSLMFDEKTQGSVKASIFKSYCDCFIEKSSKQKVAAEKVPLGPGIFEVLDPDKPDIVRIKRMGSGVWLPEIRGTDPAELIHQDERGENYGLD
jgi:hypothetical protein